MNRLHGPPKKNKRLRRDGLKGLLPYIRAVDAVAAAAHDGYSRLGFLAVIECDLYLEGSPIWPQVFRLPADTVPYLAHIDSLLRSCVQ